MFRTSIIIPAYNKWDLTSVCLESLAATIDSSQTEVIVVDNASSDATHAACAPFGKNLFGASFRYIRNEINRNFAGASNQGAELAQGRFLVFLNSDTQAEQNWLEPVLDDFTNFPNLGASGPLLVYPDVGPLGRTVQHLGIAVWPGFFVTHLYENIPEASPFAHKRRFFQFITAACMAVPKNIFLSVGKFDENFINGFEDVELCTRLGAQGLRMTVNPDAVVAHHESKSPGRNNHTAANSAYLQQKARRFFRPDWHEHVLNDGLQPKVALTMFPYAIPSTSTCGELESMAARTDPGQLRELLVANPFWHDGWRAVISSQENTAAQLQLANAYRLFFPEPENYIWLLKQPFAKSDPAFSSKCRETLETFVASSPNFLACANSATKWSAAYGADALVLEYRRLMRVWSGYEKNELPKMKKQLEEIA